MELVKNPSNARLLFDKLDLAYINENMVGKEFENNWLECKEKSRSDHGGLDDTDKKYFAKALSGFANTAGGVLIFGLEARTKEEIDQIQSIKPIQQLKRFESALREYESRAVERHVLGVEYKPIKTAGEDEGILAILIPESPHLPHRSLKDKDFYLRAGGVFSPLPLTLIEDLLFRRVRPKLNIHFYAQERDLFNIVVILRNDGKVSARWPYITIRLPNAVEPPKYELDGTVLHTWIVMEEFQGKVGAFLVFRNGANLIVHPGTEVPLLEFSIVNVNNWRNHKFLTCVAAENMFPLEEEKTIEFF